MAKKLTDGIHLGLYCLLTNLEPNDDPRYKFDKADSEKWKRYRMMSHMKWTYQEYQNTPHSVIEEIWVLMATETKALEDIQEKPHA